MYPGPEPRVPRNLLNIEDREELEQAEAAFVAVQIETLPAKAMELSYAGYKAIHRHLFSPLYEWAGQERTYTTGRNPGVPFATPENIAGWMEKQFKLLKEKNYLRELNEDQFASAAAAIINEINAAHPFIEGNGRVQRLFLQILAEQAGFDLSLDGADKDEWNEASKQGFLSSNDMMTSLIRRKISRL